MRSVYFNEQKEKNRFYLLKKKMFICKCSSIFVAVEDLVHSFSLDVAFPFSMQDNSFLESKIENADE